MASAWECSRNDVFEGFAVLLAAAGVWLFAAGLPDMVIAAALLVKFLRPAWRVIRTAWRSYKTGEAYWDPDTIPEAATAKSAVARREGKVWCRTRTSRWWRMDLQK